MGKREFLGVILRRATPEDAAALCQLAWEGKSIWGYPAEWMAAWREALTLTPHYIESNEVLCGEEAGRTIACVAFQNRGDDLWLDHFWIEVSLIGTGRGGALFRLAARHAEKLGVRRFMIESDPNAEGFYLHMGCRRVGSAVSRLTGSERVLPVLLYDIPASPAAAKVVQSFSARHTGEHPCPAPVYAQQKGGLHGGPPFASYSIVRRILFDVPASIRTAYDGPQPRPH